MNFLNVIFFVAILPYLAESTSYKINVRELRCLVCEAMLDELQYAVGQLDPNIKVDIGGYRIDATGSATRKVVAQTKSEIQLSELADNVCNKMDDYIRATYKTSGALMLLKMLNADGTMNVEFSNVDIIQDDDLNKSLKYYCEEILEEYENSIIVHHVKSSDQIPVRVCSVEAKFCKTTLITDGGSKRADL